MASPLVLITGATGHVGFAVLLTALTSGYRVRAAVRSEAKQKLLSSNPFLQSLGSSLTSNPTFTIVADLTVPGAYDNAVKDVDFIIHVASPIPSGNPNTQDEFENQLIKPAVDGTLGILISASKAPSVKRIVITSSVTAIVPIMTLMSDMSQSNAVTADSRIEDPTETFPNEFVAYAASKVKALNAAEKWLKENKTNFDVVYILPSGVMGRDNLVLKVEGAVSGTNAWLLGPVLGNKAERTLPDATVHNADVARLHVEALQKGKIPEGAYLASAPPKATLEDSRFEDVPNLVRRLFREEVESGLLRNDGVQESTRSSFDVSKTEETFGWKFQGFEEQVKDVVGWYIELARQ
jgi:nucleoside-diphosphate-sugar epimerase